MADLDLTDAATFRYWNRHVIRFADLDPAGHVNNVAYAQYFESGRVAFWEDSGVAAGTPGATTMIVRMTIDYRSQLAFPGEVRVGTRVLRLGNSSCRLGQGLFTDGDCVATSEAVNVLVDLASNRSTPIPEGLRDAILALSHG